MIAQGDACRIPLPDQSVHTACTSPPYWGLRRYAGEQGEEPLGLEATPERHVERIVEICREVRRVLRDDGVFWLNYGDCYSGRTSDANSGTKDKQWWLDTARAGEMNITGSEATVRRELPARAGSLMMMPHRVALALQQDGWIVRQDLVWFKRNPMPESVNGWRFQRSKKEVGRKEADWDERPKGWQAGLGGHDTGADSKGQYRNDEAQTVAEYEYGDDLELKRGSWRHTRAHEYVFMLVKGMQYWSNQEAVREGFQTAESENYPARAQTLGRGKQDGKGQHPSGPQQDSSGGYPPSGSGRNPRSVLDVPTAPYKGAHYATFPPNLIAPLIRATCPRWACPVCGQGWAAVVETSRTESTNNMSAERAAKREANDDATWVMPERYETSSSVKGYRPTCEHEHTQEEAVPGIVFDPFVGSGTTIAVAQQLLRHGIGIDISMEYLDQQAKIRAGLGTPSNALDELPLFAQLLGQ